MKIFFLHRFIHPQRGSTLIEVMAAVGIAIVGLMALVQLGTKSINNSGFSARQSQATVYASQALETVRLRKEQLGWTRFRSSYGGGNYCGTDLSSGSCGVGTEFTSTVTLVYGSVSGVETLTATAVVSWREGNETASGRAATVRQETTFTKN